MKMRLPLYGKILFWFFINLSLLAAAATVALRGKLRFSIFSEESVVERVSQVVTQMVKELPLQPGPKWTTVTKKYSDKYRVDFYCYDDAGHLLAGPPSPAPPEIHSKMVRSRLGPNGLGAPRPGRPPRDDDFGPPQGGPPDRDDGPPPSPDEDDPERFADGPGGPFRPPNNRTSSPRQFVDETRNPHTYWVGLRVDTLRGGDSPGYVLVSSSSPTGNGLYLDIKPFAWAAAGALALSALVWFPFVRGLTRSVRRMNDAAGRLAEGDFAARVDENRRDELGELGEGINRMAVRLKGYVDGQKRFLSDVAHELCAPTARLQMSVGILEQRAPESERERLADVREEVEHMSALVNELLQFSKASIAARKLDLQPVELRAIAEKAVHRETADTSQITVQIDENVRVLADPDLLQRAIGNLVRNALRYAGNAGPIVVSSTQDETHIHVTVADEGPGIPAEALPKIFDPFYRIDEARTRESGGVGLGLAIVKTCVESLGGTVAAVNREPSGLAVTLTFQRA